MNSQKVYQSIIELLTSVLKNDKLKYWMLKDPKFLKQGINLVNDLITLEKEHDASFEEEEWAVTFGKAIVLLTDQKHRFERLDNRSVDDMYRDYTDLIAYINKQYGIKQGKLDHAAINKEKILAGAKLSSTTIMKFDEEEAKKEEVQGGEENQKASDETVKAGMGARSGQTAQNSNPTQGNWFDPLQQGLPDMPPSPAADPRFYPYNTKPKWMPIFKIILGVIGILSAVILIAANAYAISVNFKLSESVNTITNLGNPDYNDVHGMLSWKISGNPPNGWITLGDVTNKYNLDVTRAGGFLSVITFIFYAIPAGYLGYACFAKPKSNREKYRISYFALFFTVLFFALSIIQIYHYAAPGSLKTGWRNFFSNSFEHSQTGYNESTLNQWWAGMLEIYPVKGITIFTDVAIAFLGITLLLCLVALILNPRPDRNKMVKANAEYQQAVVAAMQGHSFTYDESLFDNDEVVIKNKSKFRLWIENLFNKHKHKSKSDSKKTNKSKKKNDDK